ncbi:MAG: alpha/beta fold hydrolase [Allosphingosinicella sp.]
MPKPKQKKLKFLSRDGLKLHGILTSPEDDAKGVLLFVHGITSDREEWGIFDLAAMELAKAGIASLRFDFRGHGESKLEGPLITLDGILSDILSAWNVLEEKVTGNGKRLKRYLMGSSYGGGLAYAAAGRIGGINRIFLLAPVFDYFLDIETCAPKWHTELKKKDYFHYNELRLGRGLLNEALYFSPLEGARIRTTIFHGTCDDDVDLALSQAAAAQHKSINLISVEGAGHVLNVPDDLDLEEEASWDYIRSMIDQVLREVQ